MKIKVLDYFDFNLSRCSFCGLCSEVCPTKPIKALIMSEDYELGSYSRDTQILRVDQMRRRADRTILVEIRISFSESPSSSYSIQGSVWAGADLE
jgi:NADH-quinone oxidoreductase subunit I